MMVPNYAQASGPIAPSNFVATPISSTRIDLSWTDNSSDETGFEIQRSTDGSTWSALTTTAADAVSYSNTSLANGTLYYYRIRANGLFGNSSWQTASATTTLPAPSSLSAATASSSQIDLTWTDNSTGETAFEVERSPNGTTGWANITTTAANATSYSDTGLSPSTEYFYRVRAVKGAVASAYSASDSDTTSAGGLPAIFRVDLSRGDLIHGVDVNSSEQGINMFPTDTEETVLTGSAGYGWNFAFPDELPFLGKLWTCVIDPPYVFTLTATTNGATETPVISGDGTGSSPPVEVEVIQAGA